MRVRLIASDMDGSLLNDKKEFPPHFWEDLQALDQKGIPFVAASGRSYPKQRRDFQQAPDSAWFICDNGALVMHQDAVCFSDCLDAEGVHQIIDEMAKIPDILPVFWLILRLSARWVALAAESSRRLPRKIRKR